MHMDTDVMVTCRAAGSPTGMPVLTNSDQRAARAVAGWSTRHQPRNYCMRSAKGSIVQLCLPHSANQTTEAAAGSHLQHAHIPLERCSNHAPKGLAPLLAGGI